MPRDKYDTDSAAALISLGWEAVLPVVAEIMEWVQDSNWPVARVFSPFLAEAGSPMAPFIRNVLATDDNTWKWHVLNGIVSRSPILIAELSGDLTHLSINPTADQILQEVAELAREILARQEE